MLQVIISIIMRNRQEQNIQNSIKILKQKMDLINYQNIQPPYLLQTISTLRKTHLQQYLHLNHIPIEDTPALMKTLRNIRQIIDNLDEKQCQRYIQQLVDPYLNKMKRDEWEIDGVSFRQIQKKYHLKKSVSASIFWGIRWFIQVEKMQDLLARVELYFGIQLPDVVGQLKTKLSNRIDQIHETKTFLTKIKQMLSATLKKTSQILSSPLIMGIVSSALLMTINLLENTTIPLQMKLNAKCFVPAGLIAVIPSILDAICYTLDKHDTNKNIKNWEQIFIDLTTNLQKFNNHLQTSIKLCSLSSSQQDYQKQITNLNKLVHSLTTNIQMGAKFDEDIFDSMRKRTEGYFKEYMEIVDGDWLLVLSKQAPPFTESSEQDEQFQQLKSPIQTNKPTPNQANQQQTIYQKL